MISSCICFGSATLSDGRLQRGHAPTRRRLDNVGPSSVYLGGALFDPGEIAAQYAKPFCGNGRKLLECMPSISQLGASYSDLLIERRQVLRLLERRLLAALQFDAWQRPLRG